MTETLVGARIGHFQVRGELGRGGMGVVYDAHDERLGRNVALKVLPAALASDPMRRDRFLREARAAAKLSHAAVATVYEIGESDNRLFIAMERIEGRTLRDALAAGPLPLVQTLDIARQVASALARAHELGIVHRDLKPDNVMLCDDGQVKILDFGIAKALGADDDQVGGAWTTVEGHVLGTPGYMAPEQAQGKKCDARVDVFSFGVLLYELLTGRAAFVGETPMERVASVLRDQPPLLDASATNAPEEIRTLVAACLAKDPSARPADGAALLAALRGTAAAAKAVVRAGHAEVDPLAATMTTSAAELASAGILRPSAARTVTVAEERPAPPPTRLKGRLIALGVMVVLVATGGFLAYRAASGGQRSRSARVERQGGERGRAEAGMPPVWECDGVPNASLGQRCSKDAVAWCDPTHRQVACCAKGLVPLDRQGACGCPPGGAPSDAPAAASCDKATSAPGLDRETMHRVFKGARAELQTCFERALGPGVELRGRVVFGLRVSHDGRVYMARIQESSLPNENAQACFLEVIRGLRFPAISGGHGVELSHPYEFSNE